MMIRKDVGKLCGLPGLRDKPLGDGWALCGCQIFDRVDRLWRPEVPRGMVTRRCYHVQSKTALGKSKLFCVPVTLNPMGSVIKMH